MSEVTVEIDHSTLCKINNLLTDARENSQQLLTEHDASFGRDTKKNARIAYMYIDELKDLDEAISTVRALVG